MRFAAISCLGALCATLAGCAVGPDYHMPAQAVWHRASAQGSFTAAKAQESALPPPPAGWWRLYQDARLNQLIEQALANNSSVRVALANLEHSQALYQVQAAQAWPHAGASLALSHGQRSGESMLLKKELPVADGGDVGLSASYQVDLFGKLKHAEESAGDNVGATQAALDLARISIVAQTAQAYMQDCASGHALEVAQRVLDLQNQSTALTERLAKYGRGTALDVLRAQSQTDSLRASLPPLRAAQASARYRLAALLGLTPREFQAQHAYHCVRAPQLQRPLPVGNGQQLLQRRPDIRMAERQLAAATANIGVAMAALYPSISFGVSAGFTGALHDLGDGDTQHWSLGPLISWSLPDSGARARVRAANADSRAALARFDGVVLNALQETETALTLYNQDLLRHADLRAARDQAAAAAQATHRLYQAGRLPYLANLDAERTLANDEAVLAQAEASLAQDQVRLFLALGGGWQQGA